MTSNYDTVRQQERLWSDMTRNNIGGHLRPSQSSPFSPSIQDANSSQYSQYFVGRGGGREVVLVLVVSGTGVNQWEINAKIYGKNLREKSIKNGNDRIMRFWARFLGHVLQFRTIVSSSSSSSSSSN